jgi:protein TonB
MSQRVDIFDIKEPWTGPVSASIAFHGAILGLIIAYGAWMGFSRNQWGGGGKTTDGGIVPVTLVGASSIPLPHERQSENIVANESPAVAHAPPQPKEIPQPQPQAVPIPETTKIKPKERPRQTAEKRPPPIPVPPNQVQVGDGGQVRQNFTTVTNSISVGTSALATGGDFSSRYAYYVRQIGQMLSQNWLKYEVDPHTMPDATVSVAFDIGRNGQPTNVRISQSSGVPSLDTSAVRTLERIDTFGPLPSDYRGSSLTVESQFRYIPTKR